MTQPFSESNSDKLHSDASVPADHWPQTVCRLVSSLKYGSVQIQIQDGKVIQIDSTDKIRLDQPPAKNHYGKKTVSFHGR
jgi:hypothetical protein